MTIAQRIAQIRANLPESVRLIAVTKQVSVDAMMQAYQAGIRDFGESRIQEAQAKSEQLGDLPGLTWHLIGHLQSNKVKPALDQFQWIHSIDSLKLAQRVDRVAEGLGVKPKVCLQVKIVPDPNKSGWQIPELIGDLGSLNQCKNLEIKGLMTIPPLGLDQAKTLALFEHTRHLAQEIQAQNWDQISMQELSMGMSGDYHLAVQAGSTIVRLGTILFGERSS
ncbi:YggS family pyridoxal phosphate-dependent enzyme [Laspinema olomoucense]|uniref:Pyridoxal phosphate homeostasis protein n=1 Tax=Laspinema olomoucense D3b TaxID=2953688 RepID=A0ABT2N9P1_9CYAN|nr:MULTISPECIES: YggS family pyridoxal phosphate-dependent enzyme [unclassified Laspinema]MCT7975015.1 YggS family pyridoxal phosphate-dependent enzyme [Laspinema sp. D3d]MCT7978569.1 YggS family pyridoxal phosphate-dependent enzyme [Laspinema sp. D3b]MCT7987205.1 YggS family pyridoxal phosphate-dependent enzyme [Laspinema sp. D3a]MCT7992228.1 YggS family pyridoxal phosphate-dependent enzyme [Laspinema sp. D3c]